MIPLDDGLSNNTEFISISRICLILFGPEMQSPLCFFFYRHGVAVQN